MKNSLIYLVFILLALHTTQALAGYVSFPEYQTLDELEQGSFDRPQNLNSEYSSDVLSYSRSASWESQWLRNPLGLDLTIGSLSGSYFLIENRAQIKKQLNEYFEFRFTTFQERDLERDTTAQIIELIYWANHTFGFSIYGSASLYKRENDIGLSALYKPEDTHEIKLYFTAIDLTRNDRNDRSDSFTDDGHPYAIGLTGKIHDHDKQKPDFLEYNLRYDTKARWTFPDTFIEYNYERKLASAYFLKSIDDLNLVEGRFQWDEKFEARKPLTSSGFTTPESWKTTRLLSYLRGTRKNIWPDHNWNLGYGLAYNNRSWLTDNRLVSLKDWLPHILVNIPGFGSRSDKDRLEFQYTYTISQNQGDTSLKSSVSDYESQQRLDVNYEITFSEFSSLILKATFDMDKLGTGETWEGGNGQFRLYF